MASAFQLQLRMEELQRASELAGEAFGHGLDGQEAGQAAVVRTNRMLLIAAGTFALVAALAIALA